MSVLNVNDWDPRFRFPQYEFVMVGPPEVGALVGTVEVADGDKGDRIHLDLRGQDARLHLKINFKLLVNTFDDETFVNSHLWTLDVHLIIVY